MLTNAQAQAPATQSVDYGEESYRLTSAPGEIIAVLNNGMTVIVKRIDSPAISVRAYAKTGGVYEGKWLGGGLSHLLEHLVAGGSNERRPEAQNRDLLQKIGNNSNAYTTTDHTCYFVNTTPDHLDEAVDLVAGWMLGAKITPAEYGREYEVVQRELEMNKGEPDSVFWKLTQDNRYRVNPARVPVIGYQEVIQSLSRDEVYEYYRLSYQPNNLLFAIAGNIEPEKMLHAVKKNFKDAKPGREFSHELTPEPPVSAPRKLVAYFPKLGQARLELGFPTVKLDDPDMYPLDLLATILASGESSTLVQELRDKRRLVSGISAGDYTPHYVEGTFVVSMQLDSEKIDETTKAVLSELEKVKTTPIDGDRLARAKMQMKASRVKSTQTTEDVIASMATDFLSTGDAHFSDKYVERIQNVTAAQIQESAKKYFVSQRLLTTILMPAEEKLTMGGPTTQTISEQGQITRLQLDGDITLLHKQIKTTPLVELRMYSIGGLTAEDEKTNGLGNLTMEMISRGTKTRSADQIAAFFDSIGADADATCGNNSWSWSLTCMKEDLGKAMEVWADVIKNPAFPDSEIPPMKQRVIAAIDDQDSDWHAQAMRFFRKSYFGPTKSPYQFVARGQKEVVEKATADQMRQWYADKVIKSKRVLAIFGDVNLEQAKALASQSFGNVRNVDESGPRVTGFGTINMGRTEPPSLSLNIGRVEVQKTDQPLAGVVVGFKSDSFVGEDKAYAVTVADTMMSGFDYGAGYMYEILRGRGLVYVVHAYDMPGRNPQTPGAFIVYAGCDPKHVNEVVDVILESVARCQGTDADMQADWFARSKQLITTSDAMANETAAQQATTAALDELFGLGYDYHDNFAPRINAVTIQQVREIARAKLRECVVTVSTPLPDLVDKKTGERTYKTFPPVDLTPRGVQHDSK